MTTNERTHDSVSTGYIQDDRVYVVYNKDTDNEYTASALVSDVESNPDDYLFTPYIEYVNLFNKHE